MNNLNSIRHLIDEAESALLVSHISPDGDTIGSALGLAWALRQLGIAARVACADPVPRSLRFLPGSQDYGTRGLGTESLIFAIDCSDPERAGNLYSATAFASVPVVNIDHHVTNLLYGDVNLVDVDAAATAQLVLQVVQHLGIPLDATIATCLLTGLVTDTRSFRTSGTTPQVLRDALTLCEAGASLSEIMDQAYAHYPMALLRLWGLAFDRAELTDGILWVEISRDDMRAAAATPTMASGLVNFMSTIDDAIVALVLRELDDGQIDVSLRSRQGVNVAQVASALGGGGHPQAAGCQLEGDMCLVRERVLAALRQLLLAALRQQLPEPVK